MGISVPSLRTSCPETPYTVTLTSVAHIKCSLIDEKSYSCCKRLPTESQTH